MKLIGVLNKKDEKIFNCRLLDGFILPLIGFSCDYNTYYTKEEIKELTKLKKKIFVVINKMIFNNELEKLEEELEYLEKLDVSILYYDEAVLQIIKNKSLSIPLYYNRTHMATNSSTLNFYHDNYNLTGAYLSNELSYDEILKIRANTKLELLTLLVGYPIVSMSRRHLITNNSLINNSIKSSEIIIKDISSSQEYLLKENSDGTSFFYHKRFNASKCLESFDKIGIEYGVIKQDDLESDIYLELVKEIANKNISKIDKLIKNNRGFLYRKQVFRVVK